MVLKTTNNLSVAHAEKAKHASKRSPKKGSRVTEERAKAQRAKLDTQAEARQEQDVVTQNMQSKKAGRQEAQAKRRVIETLLEAYIQDHIGGNHSEKTIEWHRTALGLLHLFLKEVVEITQIEEVEADDISAWFAHLRVTPGARGKVRSERTIQTYARSARAFFHWLVRRGTLEHNPFDRVVFPKVAGRSFTLLPPKSSKSSCLPALLPVKRVLLPNAQPSAIVPFSGCSMIRASVFLS